MAAPVPDTVAAEILDALAPMLYADGTAPQNDALAIYINGLSEPTLQEVEDYASDDPVTGAIGYSVYVDIDRTPDKALPWLAQFVGVKLAGGLTPAQQRTQIESLANLNRGTLAAMTAAAAPFLTGTKVVIFRERFGGAYKISVLTYTSQTPDSAKVLAALNSQKPAGLVLTYNVLTGQDYQLLLTNHATYALVYSSYLTYAGIIQDAPGV